VIGNLIGAPHLENCRKKSANSGQLAPRDTQLRGFKVIALEERQSFAPSNGCEPTGAFAPIKKPATAQHDAGVFAPHKRRLNWRRRRLGSLICFPLQQICSVKIPLPDGSFLKLFDFFIGEYLKEHFQVHPRIVGYGSS
jgi:hypothetical protein